MPQNIEVIRCGKDTTNDAFPNMHIFSNEPNFQLHHEYIKQMDVFVPDNEKEPAALLIGESFFTSITPELLEKGITTIVLADIVPCVNQHNKFLIETLISSPTIEQFVERYLEQDNPAYEVIGKMKFNGFSMISEPNKIDSAKRCKGLLMNGKNLNRLAENYFLANQERYTQCREAVSQMKFIIANHDFFDAESNHFLHKIMIERKLKINLLNLSNLHEYDGNFSLRNCESSTMPWESLNRLFNNAAELLETEIDSTPILYSKIFTDEVSRQADLMPCQILGLNAYKQDTDSNTSNIVRIKVSQYQENIKKNNAEWEKELDKIFKKYNSTDPFNCFLKTIENNDMISFDLLIRSGQIKNFNQQECNSKETALHVASRVGNKSAISDLMLYRIDHTIEDKNQRTALDVAHPTIYNSLYEDIIFQDKQAKPVYPTGPSTYYTQATIHTLFGTTQKESEELNSKSQCLIL